MLTYDWSISAVVDLDAQPIRLLRPIVKELSQVHILCFRVLIILFIAYHVNCIVSFTRQFIREREEAEPTSIFFMTSTSVAFQAPCLLIISEIEW